MNTNRLENILDFHLFAAVDDVKVLGIEDAVAQITKELDQNQELEQELRRRIKSAAEREAALIGEWNKVVKAVNRVDYAIASPMCCGQDAEDAFYKLVDVMKTCKALFEEPTINGFYDLLQAAHQESHDWASKFFREQNTRWELERELEATREVLEE